jgi:hypothetical protein
MLTKRHSNLFRQRIILDLIKIYAVHTWYSSVGKATDYGLNGRGSIPDRGNTFFVNSTAFKSSLVTLILSSVYGDSFPRGKNGRGVKLITHLHLVPRLRMVKLYLHSPILFHGVVLS